MNSYNWKEHYGRKIITAAEAMRHIRPGNRIFIGTGCASPQLLIKALTATKTDVADAEILHLLTMGVAPYAQEAFSDRFRFNSFFIGENVRDAVNKGLGDYTPIFLSEIPRLIEQGKSPIDIALIQTTPPNADGMVSLGVSVDIVKSATENASLVIAEVNPNMPWTFGNTLVPVDYIDYLVESDRPLLEYTPIKTDEAARRVAGHIASLIEDGSTIEVGIGAIPQSIFEFLGNKRDLGIHTEMFTDQLVDLIESGVINGSKKILDRGKVVASFVMGTEKLYRYVNNNRKIELHPSEYVNDPFIISQHPKMVAINVGLEVDLTGQVCSDSLGHNFFSGIGGQLDFIRGAARSNGGKPIIALKSTASSGTISRIVPTLSPGAGVVTTRGDVHYVVTEYGVADLHGRSIRERAMALINIAHPKFRNDLLTEAKKLNYVYEDQISLKWDEETYPSEFERCQIIADGTEVMMRPVKPTDEELIRDFFYSLSEHTVYMRYFQPVKSMPHSKAMSLASVDFSKDMAIAMTTGDASGEKLLGVGRYMRAKKEDKTAEVAFVVRDDWQNRGIGRILLQVLVDAAIERGVDEFEATVKAGNKQMLTVFHASGFHIHTTFEDGVYQLKFRIKEEKCSGK